jgi:hypothetical protein
VQYRCERCRGPWPSHEPLCPNCFHDTAEEVRQSSNPRTRSNARHYCYRCGTPWPDAELFCPGCGGQDRAEGSAKPSIEVEGDVALFDGPWELIPWPKQGSVCVYGGPGSGKSSIASMIDPKHWITKEQEPKPVGAMFRRLRKDKMPPIHAVNAPADVERVLTVVDEGPIVLDSLTAFGLKDALVIGHMLVNWAQNHNDRVLAIIQVNKAGEAAGYMEIPHLFDCNINLSPDPWGVRSFRVLKSRWCALEAVYWSFDEEGQIATPDFPASYSVEGNPGDYWLHPYPVRGAKWSGLLAALDQGEQLRPGTASAAHVASYMPSGFVVPQDHHERRRFAERNGLEWIDPDQAVSLLEDATEQQTPDELGEEE